MSPKHSLRILKYKITIFQESQIVQFSMQWFYTKFHKMLLPFKIFKRVSQKHWSVFSLFVWLVMWCVVLSLVRSTNTQILGGRRIVVGDYVLIPNIGKIIYFLMIIK